MKCNQARLGFELVSSCPHPAMITITPEALKEALIADPTMNPVEGHNIQKMAIIQKTISDNTFGILDLQVQPHRRRWINPQGGQNCCPRIL